MCLCVLQDYGGKLALINTLNLENINSPLHVSYVGVWQNLKGVNLLYVINLPTYCIATNLSFDNLSNGCTVKLQRNHFFPDFKKSALHVFLNCTYSHKSKHITTFIFMHFYGQYLNNFYQDNVIVAKRLW